MKRYRYVNPAEVSLLKRSLPFIYMFLGWNLFGFGVWKFVNYKKKSVDESWEEKQTYEKMMNLTGMNKTKADKRTITMPWVSKPDKQE